MPDRAAPRFRLPRWITHPGFAVLALFAVAVVLIVNGEPQPSSRPSGRSVVVGSSSPAPLDGTALLVVRNDRVQRVRGSVVTGVGLPRGARPVSVTTRAGMSVVLAEVAGRRHAFAVTAALRVSDLGPADAVLPAAGRGSVVVATSIDAPGQALATTTATPSATATGSASASVPTTLPGLQDYRIQRYDSAARRVGAALDLPTGMQAAVDTSVGLVCWQPAERVERSTESLSALAALVRPDGSERIIGAVHPLAAGGGRLLVWDVAHGRFGLMDLTQVTAETTTLPTAVTPGGSGTSAAVSSSAATPTASPTASSTVSEVPDPTVSPTTVAGVGWFAATKGFVVSGPASFDPSGSSFAVYAQVGMRRRLVVGQVADVGSDTIEVLALSAQIRPSTSAATPSASVSASATASASVTPSPTPTSSAVLFAPDDFPLASPVTPFWMNGLAVGLGQDGSVVSYLPGSNQATALELGLSGLTSIAQAP